MIPAEPRHVSTRPIRVYLQQPALSHYRLPVFRELAARPGLDLTVVYGDEAGIRMMEPQGFRGQMVPLTDRHIGPMLLRHHAAQYRYCRPDVADVVILSWSTRYVSLLPGLIRARWHDLGVVLWGHGYSKRETWWQMRARDSFLKFADAGLLYNYTAAQGLIDRGTLPPRRAFVALNTLELGPIREVAARWRADTARLAEFRRSHALGEGPVVLFVSRLYEANRLDLLLAATPGLAKRFPGLQVVIVGDGPALEALRAQASALGVEHAVRFVGALYGEEQVAPWFLSADVFCYPANIGLSLIHAMSYGLPVVTGDRYETQNPEIEAFQDGVNGMAFEAGNVAALEEALGTLLADKALRERLGRTAEETVTNDYSIEKMVDGMEAAIRFAAARHGR